MAREIEKIEFHNGKEKSHNSWFRKAAEDLEVDLDDDVLMGTVTFPHNKHISFTHLTCLEEFVIYCPFLLFRQRKRRT